MDAGNKRGGQRAKQKTKCRQRELVAAERIGGRGCKNIRGKSPGVVLASSSVRILYPCEPEGCGFT